MRITILVDSTPGVESWKHGPKLAERSFGFSYHLRVETPQDLAVALRHFIKALEAPEVPDETLF